MQTKLDNIFLRILKAIFNVIEADRWSGHGKTFRRHFSDSYEQMNRSKALKALNTAIRVKICKLKGLPYRDHKASMDIFIQFL